MRRGAIEPLIGRAKSGHRVDRHFLAGRAGDAVPCSPPPATISAGSSHGRPFCCPQFGSTLLATIDHIAAVAAYSAIFADD